MAAQAEHWKEMACEVGDCLTAHRPCSPADGAPYESIPMEGILREEAAAQRVADCAF